MLYVDGNKFGLCDMRGKISGILLNLLFDVNACFGYQDIDLGLCGLVCSPMILIDICFNYIERRFWSGSFVNRLGRYRVRQKSGPIQIIVSDNNVPGTKSAGFEEILCTLNFGRYTKI